MAEGPHPTPRIRSVRFNGSSFPEAVEKRGIASGTHPEPDEGTYLHRGDLIDFIRQQGQTLDDSASMQSDGHAASALRTAATRIAQLADNLATWGV